MDVHDQVKAACADSSPASFDELVTAALTMAAPMRRTIARGGRPGFPPGSLAHRVPDPLYLYVAERFIRGVGHDRNE